jgi:hypothetical protein
MSEEPPAAGAAPAVPIDPSLRYDVTPFVAEGGCPILGTLLLAAGMAALALGLAWGVSAVAQRWFHLLLITPVLLGLLIGVVGERGVGLAKVRSPRAALLIGLGAGLLFIVGVHYFDYIHFRETVAERLRAPIARRLAYELFGEQLRQIVPDIQFDPEKGENAREAKVVLNRLGPRLDAERDNLRAQTAANPKAIMDILHEDSPLANETEKEVGAALAAWAEGVGFWEFLGVKAEQGDALRFKRGRVLSLRATWLWLVWGLECLIAGLIPAGLMMIRSGKPFCARCQEWKDERELGRMRRPADATQAALCAGEVGRLASATGDDTLALHAAVCPGCGPDGGVDVRLEKVTKKKEKEETTDLAHVAYPGAALPALEALCTSEEC